ncbi:hypothetical protein FA15DRAFT_214025 [Coprinopsis marcescibilis]|uniref:G domain-containing protein n=1 Tax=Coprinopsis marcescibilis TaxID=230819 RepID=A0A5C3KHG3_COPMA|nr:hypothetical protein FA15DRAFT_214025 [Coprinopsis marcescibilis]
MARNTKWKRDIHDGDLIYEEVPRSHDGRQDDIVIPIMGPTGVGKSSFINTLTGHSHARVGESLTSCTRNLQAIIMPLPAELVAEYTSLAYRRIVLVDTPGFDDTYSDDGEILRRIAVWLASCYDERMPVSGLIYMGDIAQKRIHGSTRLNLEMFQRLCGKKSFQSVVLVTTQWDTVQRPLGEAREKELLESFWCELVTGGAITKRVQRDNPGGHMDVLRHILEYVERDLTSSGPLKIQKEYVDQSKRIPLTEAGKKLKYTLAELRQMQENAVEEAPTEERREELRRALRATQVQLYRMKVSFLDKCKSVFQR